MLGLRKHGAVPLLRMVRGKQHATSDHHEEDARQGGLTMKKMTEEDINASPVDSDDEVEEPSRRDSPLPPTSSRSSSNSRAQGRGGARQTGKRGSKKSDRRPRPPRPGVYEQGKADKVVMGWVNEKENVGAALARPAEKRSAEDAIFGGMEYSRVKKARAGPKTYTSNIHAPQFSAARKPGAAKGYGRSKKTYGSSRAKRQMNDDDDDDELDDENLFKDPEPTSPQKSITEKPAKPRRPNLLEMFGDYAQPTPSPADSASDSHNTDGPSREAIHHQHQHLEADVAALPIEDLDSTCALCQSPVDPAQSAAFYATRPRTVRNQALFCTHHKRAAAQLRYAALGLPAIDWAALPDRIRAHRPQLLALLRNETPVESEFRTRHAGWLRSGKAAALPSRRQDGHLEEVDYEEADDSTGYYGPRGKRVMMEVISAELVDEIKEATERDPVVGRSGFAAFVQAVLVPELTVLLAMEDLGGVGEGVAKDRIGKSAELGALLNEDVDDVVGVGSGEESEGELSEVESEELEGWDGL